MANKPQTTRSFIAIPLPSTTQQQIAQLQKDLAQKFPWPISWELPQKIHLTLIFIGSLTSKQQQQVLQFSHSPPSPPHLQIDSLSYFSKKLADTIIFLEILDPQHHLKNLHRHLANQLLKNGFSPSLKFHPHLTIARIKPRYRSQIGNLSQLTQFPLPDFDSIPLKLELWSSQFDKTLNTTTYSKIPNSKRRSYALQRHSGLLHSVLMNVACPESDVEPALETPA